MRQDRVSSGCYVLGDENTSSSNAQNGSATELGAYMWGPAAWALVACVAGAGLINLSESFNAFPYSLGIHRETSSSLRSPTSYPRLRGCTCNVVGRGADEHSCVNNPRNHIGDGEEGSAQGQLRTVIKFGGSSLATGERLLEVGKLVKRLMAEGQKPIMVCSAMGSTTNRLQAAGQLALEEGSVHIDSLRTLHMSAIDNNGLSDEVRVDTECLLEDLRSLLKGVSYIRELTPRTIDHLVSFGERMSIRIMAGVLNKLGVPAQAFDSWTVGLVTNGEHGNSAILDMSSNKIKTFFSKFGQDEVPVITGFIGKSEDGRITTIGRGGSDLTATYIGSSIGADEVQVWKDVDGMLTADPKTVPDAEPVPCVSYEEAAELAYFGAMILHPAAMRPVQRASIPVRIKNSYNPSHPGTVIVESRDLKDVLVSAITCKRHISLIDIVSTRMVKQVGFISKVFGTFSKYGISVDMIATSEVSISLTLDSHWGDSNVKKDVIKELSAIADITEKPDVSIVSLIANVERSSEVMSEVFSIMKKENIHVLMLSQGASKVNISLVIPDNEVDLAISSLHSHFFEHRDNDIANPNNSSNMSVKKIKKVPPKVGPPME